MQVVFSLALVNTAAAFYGSNLYFSKALKNTQSQACRGAVRILAKKSFDKKYGDAFDDFRTSGSMPSIPSISEQYQSAEAFVKQRSPTQEQEERFDERLTASKNELEEERSEGMEAYNTLKKELVEDTLFIGILTFVLCGLWLPDKEAVSYLAGMLGSVGYSFLLTRTADSLGEQGNKNLKMASGTPARFLTLFVLILAAAKNPDTLSILPILGGFFIPYKLASLRPAIVSLPPLLPNQIRIISEWGSQEPIRIEYGSRIRGAVSRFSPVQGMGAQQEIKVGSSAPLGKRRIKSVLEMYEDLKKST